jgi:hypothetical protein
MFQADVVQVCETLEWCQYIDNWHCDNLIMVGPIAFMRCKK